jgi:hypothetical protein
MTIQADADPLINRLAPFDIGFGQRGFKFTSGLGGGRFIGRFRRFPGIGGGCFGRRRFALRLLWRLERQCADRSQRDESYAQKAGKR